MYICDFSRSDGAGNATTPENARTDALGEGPDGAALAGGVAALEDDDDAQALVLDPLLEMAQLPPEVLRNSFMYSLFFSFWLPSSFGFFSELAIGFGSASAFNFFFLLINHPHECVYVESQAGASQCPK